MNDFIIMADGEEFSVILVSTLEDQGAFEYYWSYKHGYDTLVPDGEPEAHVWRAQCWHNKSYALEFDDALEIAMQWEEETRPEDEVMQ